jgi:Ni,Fe-hydrogenase I large subunit
MQYGIAFTQREKETKMTSKNGFEIRLEVLKMAKEMMDQQQAEASNAYWNSINTLAETWNKSASELIEQTLSMKPVMYTPAEIMDKAQELYTFVSSRKD